jgi:cardiolipin synthase
MAGDRDGSDDALLSSHRFLTAPNLFTLLRLCCIPVFVWLLFGKESVVAAALLLGALGATDWVDGWLARRFRQVSEFGKMFDPTADRLLFIVGIASLIVHGSAPLWFCWAVIAREVIVGGAVAVATLGWRMERFDVTWWGKTATFLLMIAFPGFMLGTADFPLAGAFGVAAWLVGVPGLALSWYTGVAYVPQISAGIRAARKRSRPAAD